jgi:hypothetical protein
VPAHGWDPAAPSRARAGWRGAIGAQVSARAAPANGILIIGVLLDWESSSTRVSVTVVARVD